MKTIKLPLPAEERDLIGRIYHSHPGDTESELRMQDWLDDLRDRLGVRLHLIASAAELSPSTIRGLVTGRAIALQGVLAIVHAVRRHNRGQLDLCEGATPPMIVVARKQKAKRAVQISTQNVPCGTKKRGGAK